MSTLLTGLVLAALLQVHGPFVSGAGGGRSPDLAGGGETLTWTVLKPSNTGIPGDNCYDVLVDAQDRPWIPGFVTFWEEGGMARWERDDDTWLALSNVDRPEITSPRFNDIEMDANGVLWVGTWSGLMRYDPETDVITWYDASNSPLPGDSRVGQVEVAPDGSLWLGVHNNTGPNGGLVHFDPSTDSWQVYTTANGLPWGQQWPGWDWVDDVAVAPEPGGGYGVWFASNELGMGTLVDGTFTWFETDPPDGVPLPYGLPGNDATDAQGHLWLSTVAGPVRREPDGTFTPVPLPPGGSGTLEAFDGGRAGLVSLGGGVWVFDGRNWTSLGNWGAANGYAIARESGGAVWVAGNTGAARYEGGQWQRYRVTNTGMLGFFVDTIDFDAAGNVYMNGNAGPGVGGFTIYDGQRWTSVNDLNYGLGPVWGQPSDDVRVLATRADGTLALDAYVGGLQQWDGAGYTSLNPAWNTFGLDEDGLGRLWSGNAGRLFLYTDGQMVMFDDNNSPMPIGEVNTIVADPATPGFVWVATPFGIVHSDGVDFESWPREALGLTPNSLGYYITSLAPAADGTLWVGSGVGLYHFDPATLDYTVFTTADTALPANAVNHVVITSDGSVWCTTFDFDTYPYPGGLTRFDGLTWTTWTMADSPLPHNQAGTLTARDVDGGYEVWIGTESEGVGVLTVRSGAPQAGKRQAP